jgi:aryl-alcohol dehydrogenase-like predicted oxidoreductase
VTEPWVRRAAVSGRSEPVAEMRALGRTDLRVHPLCLGGNTFGWTTDEQASFAVLDAYVEAGGNFIDTADAYSRWVPGNVGGESETILGKWMRARGNRDRVILATKLGAPMGDGPGDKGLSAERIARCVEDSLRRLQTDVIDLYQAHYDDLDTPIEETMAAFDRLVRAGKVRWLGVSNFDAERIRQSLAISEQHGWARYECLQPPYNLVDRASYEAGKEQICVEHGLGVIVYYAVASGFLTGKYHRDAPLPNTPRVGGVQQRSWDDRAFRILAEVERVAAQHSATPSQVALAWILARPSVTCPIASGTSPEQVRELIGGTELTLDPAALDALNRVSA